MRWRLYPGKHQTGVSRGPWGNPVWWWEPICLMRHDLEVSVNQCWIVTHLSMRWRLYPGRHQTGISEVLGVTQYVNGNQYFHWDTVSMWLPTKTEERFTCPWDGVSTLLGIKLVFQDVSRVTHYADGDQHFSRDTISLSLFHLLF